MEVLVFSFLLKKRKRHYLGKWGKCTLAVTESYYLLCSFSFSSSAKHSLHHASGNNDFIVPSSFLLYSCHGCFLWLVLSFTGLQRITWPSCRCCWNHQLHHLLLRKASRLQAPTAMYSAAACFTCA